MKSPLVLALLVSTPGEEDRVISFKGLLELEAQKDVADARKEAEWAAFVERTEAQLAYARKAVRRWRNAERARLLAAAIALDGDAQAEPVAKEKAWLKVAETRKEEEEVEKAQARAEHWHRVEAERLVQRARTVEEEGALKGARIKAWQKVVAWARPGSLREAARARIAALQARLLEEARALDQVDRVDPETKLAAWRAVLDGAPDAQQAAEARRRMAALQ